MHYRSIKMLPWTMLRLPLAVVLLALGLLIAQPTSAAGNTYYVAVDGDDRNSGTETEPFRTFDKAMTVLQPGDTLLILGGTYQRRLQVNISGTADQWITIRAAEGEEVILDGDFLGENLIEVTGNYIEVSYIEVREAQQIGGTDGTCVSLLGTFIVARGLNVHECQGHGIYTDGQYVLIDGNEVYNTNLAYSSRTFDSGWGSGIKVRVGGDHITIHNNTVYHNYGEGIAVTRTTNSLVQNNTVYDNYAVNIYVDNSYDIVVDRNFVTCKDNPDFNYLDGARMSGIALAEEEYDGWGAQLARVLVKNNIVAGCRYGLVYFGADIPGGGLDTVSILNNTFWDITQTGISLTSEPFKTRNTVIANNISQHAESGKHAFIADPAGIDIHHNFWVGARPVARARGDGDLFGEVNLAGTPDTDDPTQYQLASNSRAIDAGVNIDDQVLTDYQAWMRDENPDMGAFEFGAAP